MTIFTSYLSHKKVVRYFDMSSAIRLIIELFSTLSACKPASSFQNIAAITYEKGFIVEK